MIPLRVYVENFLSYREGQELRFDGAPLWVLAGPNGAGKSTIFDAITLALYGLHRGGKQNVKDLINHQADALKIEFDFLVEGEAYRICRTVPRRGRATREAFRLIPSQSEGKPSIEPIPNTDNDSGLKCWVESTIGLNDKAFTSCVLLLQGQSDKLLQAEPKERYEILKQLIDLSAYERLHKLADERRKEREGQVNTLKDQSDSVPSVSSVELQAAQDALNQADKNWQNAQVKLEDLTRLIEKSRQWEKLIAQIEEQQNELQNFHQLIERTEEIEKGLAHFQELGQVIPLLKSVIKQRERLVEKEQQIQQLQQECQQVQNELSKAESDKKSAENQIEQLTHEIERLQNKSTDLINRLSELAPLVERLSQLETIQAQLNEWEQKLAAFPLDLAQAVQQAEVRDKQLAELETALPWLRQLAQSRSDLADALNREKSTNESLKSLVTQLQEYQNQHKQLSTNIEAARTTENKLSHEITRAQTEYEAVRQRRERFEEAAHQPTCELCGQEITPEHAQRERGHLDNQIVLAETYLNNLKIQHQKAQEYRNQLTEKQESLNQQLKSIGEKYNESKNQQNQAQRDSENSAIQVKSAFNNLPTAYRIRVSPSISGDNTGWLDTTYPREKDLKELNQEVSGRAAHVNCLKELRQQFEEWQRLNTECQTYRKQLTELEKFLPLNQAQQASIEENNLRQAQEELQSQIKELRTEQEQARNIAAKASQAAQHFSVKLQQSEIELSKNRGIQGEIESSLKSDIESLPEAWQERATEIESYKLEELETQWQGLSDYENLSRELNSACQSIAFIKQQISNLNTQIEQLPQEARSAAEEIEQELNGAKTQREECDANRRNAEREFNKLVGQRERRSQLEKDLREAEREHHLYKLLSNLLGKDKEGLQLQLLRRAERAIVELANEILDSLSRGRMRLELRSEGEESGSESDKALDLVVYNYDTGHRPTAVGLTSGSQRFRIAVSLALAIGRYAGQGARRIESVIIDEGFGSLDKNGRDDMIHELNELQQQLARIILVSHQEEFSSVFPNGYAVELVNGASKVSLLENA